jgi:hypothetical protein
MAYNGYMLDIAETVFFTRQVVEQLTDDEYRLLQAELVTSPDLGVLIPGGGGLRKIRWHRRGQGKRGGVRVIYYWAAAHERILMLFMYPKNERSDLTTAQIKVLRRIVEEEYS